MVALAFSLILLILSCSGPAVRVEYESIKKRELLYHLPVKGRVQEKARGYFISTRCGAFFRAVEGGKVAYSGKDLGNYGWIIIIEQEDGNVGVYGKVGKPWVNQGEKVKRRQVLGKVGRSKGKCGIYFEVRNSEGTPLKVVLQ